MTPKSVTGSEALLTPRSSALTVASTGAQSPSPCRNRRPAPAGQRSGSDPQFKVRLDFNRWHDTDEIKSDLQRLEKAWPKFLKYSSIGKSHGGRDMMLMTINNPDTGADTTKPAMYIEANVHGNEIQGAEVSLYTIWYLMEHYDRIPQIKKLVDERVFYIVPTVNPDGRDHFLKGTGAGARTGHVPVDDDNDGVADEDDVDDLNGNGVIEQIRKYVPGQGHHAGQQRATSGCSSRCRRAKRATGCCSATKGSTTTATAASTRIRSAATTATATGRPTGSRTTSRAARWTIRSSCPRRGRSTTS